MTPAVPAGESSFTERRGSVADKTGIAGRIHEILLPTLANRPTLDEIARLLGTTTRTLRRQLRHENVSFRQLMDDLRAHIAVKYLQETTMTNEDIAFALGFSDAANFRHAFRRWTNKTPSELRRLKHRDRAPAKPDSCIASRLARPCRGSQGGARA
jgi:AraC-like DNA-binding protein